MAGDPEKAVAVILKAVDADQPPLAPVAYATAERKLDAFQKDMDALREVAIATEYS